MEKVIVHYKVKPGWAEENEKLVRAVYLQLHEESPPGFSYATYKLADGHTFVHVAIYPGEGKSPLTGLAAFKTFQAGITERCEEQPVVNQAMEIGSYSFGQLTVK